MSIFKPPGLQSPVPEFDPGTGDGGGALCCGRPACLVKGQDTKGFRPQTYMYLFIALCFRLLLSFPLVNQSVHIHQGMYHSARDEADWQSFRGFLFSPVGRMHRGSS
ncbi:hypothetical protein BaRGS_00022169 [Batillaria attramentaria]|uniref:Uncharacterized protein n=1 Tax=Batillaria attramentaria TaxID=370345 RepID=A0ABD0KHL2_9CAEN